ncbi:cell wall integrity and stress response component 3 [Drosophila santomea]|uniref:cell wall integrity and stress response component 3 n=1 Tax=Drosophila santomea TaxID=129105 RepID=UPI001954683F|nr:cell wall integrity and stress response component 3 [Drosophila santomea]
MNLLIWLCLLGSLATVHSFGLDFLGDIFGLEDSDNSSHNKTAQQLPTSSESSGIFDVFGTAAKVFNNVVDGFSKGVLGLLGSFGSGDDEGESTPSGNTASATTESTSTTQETTTTRASTSTTTATTTESSTDSTVETSTTDLSTSTSTP